MTDTQNQQLQPDQAGRERERKDEAQREENISGEERLPEDEEELPGALGEEAGEIEGAGLAREQGARDVEQVETDDLEGGQYDRREQTNEPIEGSRELEEDGVENR